MSACKHCQKPFGDEENFVNVAEQTYHPACFSCAKCGLNFIDDAEKIGQPFPSDDKFICGACFHGVCEKCKKPTIGPHLTVEGKLYHKECCAVPKCVQCGKDLFGKYIVVEGKGSLHEECYP